MCCSNSSAKSFMSVEREEEVHDQYYRCSLERYQDKNGDEKQRDKKKKKKKKKYRRRGCSGSSGCECLQQRMRILHSLVHSSNNSCSSSSSSCSACCCCKASCAKQQLNPDDEECILDDAISYLKQLQGQVGFISNCWMNSNNNNND